MERYPNIVDKVYRVSVEILSSLNSGNLITGSDLKELDEFIPKAIFLDKDSRGGELTPEEQELYDNMVNDVGSKCQYFNPEGSYICCIFQLIHNTT